MPANEAYITGVGQSEVGVKLTRLPLLLTLDAVREALSEAGLTIGQIVTEALAALLGSVRRRRG